MIVCLDTLLSCFVSFVLIAITAVFILYNVRFCYWKKRNVYTWKPIIPFGNAKDVILQRIQFGFDITEIYKDAKQKSLEYAGYYLFLNPCFIPVNIDLIKKICVSDFEYFPDRISYVDEENDPISTNLVYLSGDRWKIIRPVIRPFVTSKYIRRAFPLLQQCSDTLLNLIKETLKKEDALDIKDIFDRFSIDLIGAFFLKIDCNTMMNSNATFKKKVTNFFNTSVKDNLIRLTILLPAVIKFFKIKTFNVEVTDFFTQFVGTVLEDRKNKENTVKDVLYALISNSTPIRKQEVIGNIAGLFLAGHDATSNSICFCLYELVLHKDLQDAVRVEIQLAVKNHGGKCTYDSLEDMGLLDRCIKETLRKYPMATTDSRTCKKDYHVPGSSLVISKGTHVYIPLRAIHWDPEFYPNPEVFDPERFNEENNKNRHPYAYMPFGVGPRHCIGYKLANLAVKLSLAALLENYEFLLHPSTDINMRYNPKAYLLEPLKPLRLIAKEIKN